MFTRMKILVLRQERGCLFTGRLQLCDSMMYVAAGGKHGYMTIQGLPTIMK